MADTVGAGRGGGGRGAVMTLSMAEAARLAKCHPDTLADLARALGVKRVQTGHSIDRLTSQPMSVY